MKKLIVLLILGGILVSCILVYVISHHQPIEKAYAAEGFYWVCPADYVLPITGDDL